MKKIRTLMFVLAMVFVLTYGQTPATIASTSTGNAQMSPNFLLDDPTFDVNIYYVGPSVLEEAELQSDGAYHLVSDTDITVARLKVNVSGYTMWDGEPYVGSLFAVVNGKISQLFKASVGEVGIDFTVVKGENIITIVYMGKDQTNGFQFASDTVIIRVRGTGEAFNEDQFSITELPVEVNLVDEYDSFGEAQMNTTTIAWNAFTGYSKDPGFEPTGDITISYSDPDSDVTIPIGNSRGFYVSPEGKITIDGTVNSLGFDDIQTNGYDLASYAPDLNVNRSETLFDASKGHVFLFDAAGAHLIDEADLKASIITTSGDETLASYLSVGVFAEFGRWDLSQDVFGTVGPDWEGLNSAIASNGTTTLEFYGSFDFVWKDFGVGILSAPAPETNVSTVNKSPGFGVVVSLISVGMMAYVAPKLRKEE